MRLLGRALMGFLFLIGLMALAIRIWIPGQQPDYSAVPSIPHPAFKRGAGPVVCIDDGHHNAHTSTGTYGPFAQLLIEDGYRVLSLRKQMTSDVLKPCAILVTANAAGAARPHFYGLNLPIPVAGNRRDPAFEPNEVAAITDWVRRGGSLLLVADHAPFGEAAAGLAKAVGVDMSGGVTSAPNHDPSATDPTQLVFSGALLGNHPVLRGRNTSESIHRVVTFTGQSLSVGNATALLRLPKGATDDIMKDDKVTTSSADGRAQAIALDFGRGRVLVVGEAAALTAQHEGGSHFGFSSNNNNAQFVLNMSHWLARLI